MDFRFTTEQDEAAALAAEILGDRATNDHMKAVEAAGDRFDRDLWRELGDAGLLSLALPEAYGGAGLGVIELGRVLVEVGRRVAPVPLAVHAPAALVLAESGDHGALVTAAAAGTKVLTAAVAEPHAHLPERPTVTAEDGRLTGTKTLVRAGTTADAFLVTAVTGDRVGVHLVAADAEGVTREAQRTSDGDATALVRFTDAPATPVGDAATSRRLEQLLVVCAAAEQLGVTEGALRLTAAYAQEREQFKRPIGTFQAVAHRLADGYIDVLAQRLTLWQAIWRVSEGLDAATEVAVAKYWAADAGHRLAHTTTHVHGGVGIDLDGEAHRYFTAAKRFEFTLGGATEQALRVGRDLAAT
ncbi:acyl-CoA/acyl-ACP dehydrogenase [Nocardioides panacisoli]|uniref:acyl-CoA dehydrogenase family protein n=1 Tax=Nocardioides panacisoli TaxID=627624 RepID=UPI001C636082|nr:acyl-CoA dehydrogenase family protein [Nocardioides panacisoli]QYJ04950.1 acyl-CoA/acyl-ACP dehydrogenase [Nocardioides panacisoli]